MFRVVVDDRRMVGLMSRGLVDMPFPDLHPRLLNINKKRMTRTQK